MDMILLSHDHHLDNLDHSGRKFLSSAPRVYRRGGAARRKCARPCSLAKCQHPASIVVFPADAPESAIYFSGDTVWFDGVAEVARRFPIRTAVLFMGAARVPAVGPFALTMTA